MEFFFSNYFETVAFIFVDSMNYWWPFIGGFIVWKLYIYYIRAKWMKNNTYSLLEIKMPKNISKSPLAMEVVLSAMYQGSEGSLIDQYVKGRCRSSFSLEMISDSGNIRFFIRSEFKYKNIIESNIYSQYPGVEVFDRSGEDYAYRVSYGLPGSDWNLWGAEWKLTAGDAYPIKTYVDYGLDKDPKEEFKIDPMTPILELLGSLGPGEQMWYQIVVQATFKEWKDEAKNEIEKIRKVEKGTDDSAKPLGMMILTPGERLKVEALERSVAKYGFDTGIRTMYLGKGEKYNGLRIPHLLSTVKQFSSLNLNGFKPALVTDFDYPWQDFMGIRLKKRKWRMFDDYRRRAFYYPPASKPMFILNTEELATLFHLPGEVGDTPNLERISSKRGEPPTNLPIG